jgi:hypothetical protein
LKNTQVRNIVKIRPMTAELFHADGQMDRHTDRHDEANNRFSQFLWIHLKWRDRDRQSQTYLLNVTEPDNAIYSDRYSKTSSGISKYVLKKIYTCNTIIFLRLLIRTSQYKSYRNDQKDATV